jgi:ABC-2 type transport system permease protein
MFKRIWSISIKEFIHLRNDWWLPAFMLVGGAMELLLVGWATSRPITNLPLIVFDQDQSKASREMITALENTETFVIDSYVNSYDQIKVAMDHGNINAAIIFPQDFSEEISKFDGHPVLPVILNGAESIPATAALRAIEGVALESGEEIIIQRLGISSKQFSGFDLSLRVWFNESLSDALYTTPAELALMLEFTILLFAALAFSRERELGTLEQLLVMPFSSLEIIIGKSIPVVIIGFFDFLLMLTLIHFIFNVPIRGSLILLLILLFGYIFVELGKGMVVSVMSRTQHQAFLLVLLLGMTDFMFTGYTAPVESMPEFIQTLANLIPAHHWLFIVRGILLKGSGLDILWPHVLALLVLGLVIGSFSLRYVRKALD